MVQLGFKLWTFCVYSRCANRFTIELFAFQPTPHGGAVLRLTKHCLSAGVFVSCDWSDLCTMLWYPGAMSSDTGCRKTLAYLRDRGQEDRLTSWDRTLSPTESEFSFICLYIFNLSGDDDCFLKWGGKKFNHVFWQSNSWSRWCEVWQTGEIRWKYHIIVTNITSSAAAVCLSHDESLDKTDQNL